MIRFEQAARRPLAEFAAEVAERRAPGAKAPADEYIITNGPASLSVRARGAFITHLSLRSEQWSDTVSMLHAGSDLTVPKLSASHAMAPVGRSHDIGGQHGPMRWADYEPFDPKFSNPNEALLAMRMLGASGTHYALRNFFLSPSRFAAITSLINPITQPVLRTSLGEHYYFKMPTGSVRDIRFNSNDTVDGMLGRGVSDKIAAGNAAFWPEYSGEVRVSLPGMPRFKLKAEVVGQTARPKGPVRPGVDVMYDDTVIKQSPAAKLGMLIWKRPGEPYVCLEPTFGYHPEDGNDLLTVPPDKRVSLLTNIVVL
jgi:hypothetical protein